MALQYVDRVKETTTSVGVGPVFLLDGPVAKGGYRGFVDKIGNGKQCAVLIEDKANNAWAIYAARIIQGSPDSIDAYYLSSSSNDDNPINFAGGEKEVSCIQAGEDMADVSTLAKSQSLGGGLIYDATFGFRLLTGATAIQGFTIGWTEINGPGPSGHAVSKMHYCYIYDDNNDGIGELDFSTVAPSYDPVNHYFQKSGDPTRRLINAVLVNASGVIPRFYSHKHKGHIAMEYGTPTSDTQVFSGVLPVAWTELISLQNFVPVGATTWAARIVADLPSQNNTLTTALDSESVAGRTINDAKAVVSITAPRSSYLQTVDFISVMCNPVLPLAYVKGEESGVNTAQLFVRGWTMSA